MKNDFKSLIAKVRTKLRKQYKGKPVGMTILATGLTNYYFDNFYTVKKDISPREDFKLNKLAKLVCFDLLQWLLANYFKLTTTFDFQSSIKKWEEKIGYSRN